MTGRFALDEWWWQPWAGVCLKQGPPSPGEVVQGYGVLTVSVRLTFLFFTIFL